MKDTELGGEYEELRMVGCENRHRRTENSCWISLMLYLAIESKYKNNISNYINLQNAGKYLISSGRSCLTKGGVSCSVPQICG